MRVSETKMYSLLSPHLGDKLSRTLCAALQLLYPSVFGAGGGTIIGLSVDTQHAALFAFLGGITAGAVFNSVKLIIDFTRAKNKEVAEIINDMLNRQDALRTEQRTFYQEREKVSERDLLRERRAKHIFVNRLDLERQKVAFLRRGGDIAELEDMFAKQERQLYDAETETARLDSGEYNLNEGATK